MSIDVFGRKLEKGETSSSRGPPGIGFKLTDDNQFDLEKKRLCNVASPNDLDDAVNLSTLQRTINSEIEVLRTQISGVKEELKNLNFLVDAYRVDMEDIFRKLHPEIKSFDNLLTNKKS